ncbi:hypothetical protein Plec18170_006364 [Paecilomyces lecythidis]
MGMFSLHDEGARSLQYHHTALRHLNGSIGTKKVDGDSIYRTASISKLITTYAGMIELDENDWNIPLSDIYPAFKNLERKTKDDFDAVQYTQWDRITIGDIAAQLGGISRLGFPLTAGDILLQAASNPSVVESWGLPPPNFTATEARYPCAKDLASGSTTCSIENYTIGIASDTPRYLPAASPLYSDSGFFLLGGALSNLTNMSMDDLYRKAIFDPLGLENTMSEPPSDPAVLERTVVAGNADVALVNVPITTPSGGIFSTVNDLSVIGTSILNSTLLSTDKTNRWMKPVSFTGDLRYAVGRPWEIYRYVHHDSEVVTDIYTKLGDSGVYGGLLVLLPDFDFGFTILGANDIGIQTQAIQLVADLVIDSLAPALLGQAHREALVNLAGSYTAKDKRLNTTLTLSVPSSSTAAPGLLITEWISNGTDIKNRLAASLIDLVPHLPQRPASPMMLRLVPTIQSIASSGQISFQMETVNPTGPIDGHLFSQMYDVNPWASTMDQPNYNDIPINEFVFSIDKNTGKAGAVTPSAYKVELERKE